MKKLILRFLLFVIAINAFAQVSPPEAFNYSGVARNANNNPIANQTIGVQLSVLKTSQIGTIVYQENHFVNTDDLGLFNLMIGTGSVQSGVFANIDWSNDNYYLKVGLDASGGTNFVAMGTTQLLSVPYAMYAKRTGTTQYQTLSISNDTIFLTNGGLIKLPYTNNAQGKTHIILEGDITNTQAANKIQQELGPHTEYVWILNTTQLTNVTFNGITELIGINVRNNNSLLSVSFPNLEKVYESITFRSNNVLQSLTIPNLSVSYGLSISDNEINTLAFPSLTKLYGPLAVTLDSTLTSLSFPLLTYAGSNIEIINNPLLSSLDVPSLTSVNGAFNVYNNKSLTSFTLPAFSSISLQPGANIDFGQNKLSSSVVNNHLSRLASFNPPLSAKTIRLSNQTPSAPPTGQGVIDKQTLINNGNTVNTD